MNPIPAQQAPDGARGGRIASGLRWAFPFLVFLAAVLLLQWHGDAYRAEFAGHADEAAHYVTGLMVRDYLAAGLPWPPMKFAERYYLHYPKVALGHWPPVFYLVQAAWTLPLPATRASLLVLMAVLTALSATVVFGALRARLGAATAWGATAWLLALPMFRELSRMVMTEVLLLAMVLLAAFSLARYLETERTVWAVRFGLWASVALLTKAHAVILAPAPLVAALLAGRLHLLRRLSFWLPALIVAAACAPWYLLAPGARHESVAAFGGLQLHLFRPLTALGQWAEMLGVIPCLLAAVGLIHKLRSGGSRGLEPFWAVLGALLASTLAAAAGLWEYGSVRPHVPAVVCCLAFAAAGARYLVTLGPPRAWTAARKAWVLAAVLAPALAWNLYRAPPKPANGLAAAARDLLARPDLRQSVFLVASDSFGEGALISEIAMREARPGHFVLRGSKVLARSSWMGDRYELRYRTPAELAGYLDSIPVGVLVVDLRPPLHASLTRLLLEMLRAYPDRWQPLAAYPPAGSSSAGEPRFLVCERAGHQQRARGKIRVDLENRLKRQIGE